MSVKMVVDYGRSTTKAVSELGDNIIYPSWFARKVVDPEDDYISKLRDDYKREDYLKVKINGQEFNVGKLASKSSYCFDGSSHSDILPDDFEKEELTKAEVNILTALALLSNKENIAIDLMTTLPANQFNPTYKEIFKDRLENKDFTIKIYDYKEDKYKDKRVYINSLQVKKQGFCAFMNYLLTNDGYVNKNTDSIMSQSVVVFDIGRYSTDILALDNMEEMLLSNTDKKIKGMDDVFEQIRKDFESRHKFPITNKTLKYVKQGYVPINGNKEDISDIINKAYKDFAIQIKSELETRLPVKLSIIEKLLICGGGAKALDEVLSKELKRDITIIKNPRMANALGGIKMMKFQENLDNNKGE